MLPRFVQVDSRVPKDPRPRAAKVCERVQRLGGHPVAVPLQDVGVAATVPAPGVVVRQIARRPPPRPGPGQLSVFVSVAGHDDMEGKGCDFGRTLQALPSVTRQSRVAVVVDMSILTRSTIEMWHGWSDCF